MIERKNQSADLIQSVNITVLPIVFIADIVFRQKITRNFCGIRLTYNQMHGIESERPRLFPIQRSAHQHTDSTVIGIDAAAGRTLC